jgi:hypothetical protein
VIDFFRRMTKEAVMYRQKNNIKRNDFLQLLIHLKDKAEDVNNSKDKSVPWYKSKYTPWTDSFLRVCLLPVAEEASYLTYQNIISQAEVRNL